ncbi:MAG TPA: hypothetical protein VNY05_22335 [Candidatus Acidoferrales bacterium]|jgi:antitoxin ParD1/3/4|nr:hypothetical protein [Candidatus Acidoferrales bacterium]
MTVELKPEIEALIQEQLRSGAYAKPEDVIERALEFLAAEEDWLAANRAEIAAQIEEGWASTQRGELTDAEQVRAEMLRFKEDWDKQRRPA